MKELKLSSLLDFFYIHNAVSLFHLLQEQISNEMICIDVKKEILKKKITLAQTKYYNKSYIISNNSNIVY